MSRIISIVQRRRLVDEPVVRLFHSNYKISPHTSSRTDRRRIISSISLGRTTTTPTTTTTTNTGIQLDTKQQQYQQLRHHYHRHQRRTVNVSIRRSELSTAATTTTPPSSTSTSSLLPPAATVTATTTTTDTNNVAATAVISSSASSSSHNNDNYKRTTSTTTIGIAIASLAIGYGLGYTKSSNQQYYNQKTVLPNGLPRTCCDKDHDEDHNDDADTVVATSSTSSSSSTSTNQLQLSDEQKHLPLVLSMIVGDENVIADATKHTTQTLPYLKGARIGVGTALCIVTPTRLQQVVDIVYEIINCNCTILVQGQNTGLTGGSVPRQQHQQQQQHDRPIVIISMKKLNTIFPLDGGQRLLCQPGVGLADLQSFINKYFPTRESHSQLGSTFLNPTVGAGLAFGSGGTQCRKGPAYTERALYLQVTTNKWNEKIIKVKSTLDIDGFDEYNYNPLHREAYQDDSIIIHRRGSTIIKQLDNWCQLVKNGYTNRIRYTCPKTPGGIKPAHDDTYAQRLCSHCTKNNTNTNTTTDTSVSRYNADTRGPDYCRSEGKVIVLASIHDTFPKPKRTKTLWIGFDSIETALAFRTDVCLQNPIDLPIMIEYLDRDSFDIINRSGRLLGLLIKYTGTSSSLIRYMWNVKLYIEALPFTFAPYIVDTFLHSTNNMLPSILPKEMMSIGTKYDHNVAVTIGDFSNTDDDDNGTNNSLDRFMERFNKFRAKYGNDESKVKVYECKDGSRDVDSVSAFRFVAAPAFRTWCVGEQKQGISIDYALPIVDGTVPTLPVVPTSNSTNDNDEKTVTTTTTTTTIQPVKRMRYSHFACNVVHEDIAYEPGVDVEQMKHTYKDIIEQQFHGKLPAEHGHGTEYVAPPDTQQRWKRIDPLNVFNPGIGGLSSNFRYYEP